MCIRDRDGLPDPGDGGLAVGKLLDRVHPRQAVPDLDQATARPFGSELGEFFLRGKSLRAGCVAGLGLLLGSEDRNVVLAIDDESSHLFSPFLVIRTITFIALLQTRSKGITLYLSILNLAYFQRFMGDEGDVKAMAM